MGEVLHGTDGAGNAGETGSRERLASVPAPRLASYSASGPSSRSLNDRSTGAGTLASSSREPRDPVSPAFPALSVT